MIKLYDADRCPYCARVRIVLAEKGIDYGTVEVDLADRPSSIYEKNPLGKVQVLEEGALVLYPSRLSSTSTSRSAIRSRRSRPTTPLSAPTGTSSSSGSTRSAVRTTPCAGGTDDARDRLWSEQLALLDDRLGELPS